MQQNPSEKETGNHKEYPFIREVIKPARKRGSVVKRVLWIVCGAAAAGLIAAFVFVKFCPVAERMIRNGTRKKDRVSVVTDSTVSSAASSDVSSGSGTPSPKPRPTENPTPTATPTPAATPEPAPEEQREEEEQEDPVAQYRDLQKNLNYIAFDCEKFIVQVTGIESELDYFNDSYENEKQVTGVTVAEDGNFYYILTDSSALEDAEHISVCFASYRNEMLDGDSVHADANTGLAIVRIAKDQMSDDLRGSVQIAQLGTSYTLGRGEPVIAVGSPLGFEGMVSAGSITSVGTELSLYDTHYHLFTTDITGSQSGSGVLINLDGKVVGIIRQSLGTAGDSVVQALGISELSSLINILSNDEPRAYAGIRGDTVTEAIRSQTGIPQGMLIREVEADGPAMLSGLMQLDVIVKIDDREISSYSDYASVLSECRPDQTIVVTAMRKGAESYEEMTFEVQLSQI